MGVTPNGYIAKEDGNSEWTSEDDIKGFFECSKKCGNIIMGKNTFLEALRQGYFPFPEALNLVMSHDKIANIWGESVLVTSQLPWEILSTLDQKGFKEAFLAGGGALNSSFLKEKLIDEIYFDIEPLLFGKGIKVFSEVDFECELELMEVNKLNANTVQLHYKVIK